MTLTLAIRNTDRLDNGAPTELVLNRRGAVIGRAPTCDWSLPDARNYISSRHCEVAYRDGFYFVADVSTNGTFLNGAGARMGEPRRVVEGDRFLIGQYEVVAHLSGAAAAALDREHEEAAEARQASEWGGWDAHGAAAPPAAPGSGWDATRSASGSDLGSHAAPLGQGAGWSTGSDWASSPPAASDGGWGSPPAGGGGGWAEPAGPSAGGSGWSAPPADAVSDPGGWAPKLGTPLAREAEHLAQGRAAAGLGRAAPASSDGWATPAPAGGGSDAWAAPATPPPPPPGPSTWDAAAPPAPAASGWSSAAPDRPPPPSTNDVWGALAAGNVVDWANSGFGQPLEDNRDPLGLDKPSAPAPRATPSAPPPTSPAADAGWSASSATHATGIRPERTLPPSDQAASPVDHAVRYAQAFAAAAGLAPGQIKAPAGATLDRAGQLLRRLVGGLVVMVEARARAKSQMGAEATSLSFDGNNPIKFARTPEQALAQLLNPVERGFMDADKAIDDAFFDLQSHQMATLKAMQGALRATLDRFSPTAIRARAEQRGLFQRIMPGAREAALWQAYEREFSGVAQGSDEAFMDTFAKEFRRAYEEQTRGRKR